MEYEANCTALLKYLSCSNALRVFDANVHSNLLQYELCYLSMDSQFTSYTNLLAMDY